MMKTDDIKTSQPLPLEKAFNVRDLGGYCNKDGETLRQGSFLRADALSGLTGADKRRLEDYGVAAIVDLRSPMEAEHAPCIWKEAEGVDYYSVPLFDNIQSNDGAQAFPHSLYELYVNLLDNSREQIHKVMEHFLKYKEGCCLFHCTAGKDRTGIIAMLLLGLADVDRDTIAADYSASAGHMEPVFARQRRAMEAAGYGQAEFLLRSDEEEMYRTMDYVEQKYGGIREYLLGFLSEQELKELRGRLV